MDRIDTGVEQADEWRYEGPCGDLAGAIATEGGKIGRTDMEREREDIQIKSVEEGGGAWHQQRNHL